MIGLEVVSVNNRVHKWASKWLHIVDENLRIAVVQQYKKTQQYWDLNLEFQMLVSLRV